MTLRYAHLSPRYLADEVKALDRVQQDGKPHPDTDAEQAAPSQKDQGESESAEPDSGQELTPPHDPRASLTAQPTGGQSRQSRAADAWNRQKIGKVEKRLRRGSLNC